MEQTQGTQPDITLPKTPFLKTYAAVLTMVAGAWVVSNELQNNVGTIVLTTNAGAANAAVLTTVGLWKENKTLVQAIVNDTVANSVVLLILTTNVIQLNATDAAFGDGDKLLIKIQVYS